MINVGDVLSTARDINECPWGISCTLWGILSTMGGYHDTRGGFMSIVEGVQYHPGIQSFVI